MGDRSDRPRGLLNWCQLRLPRQHARFDHLRHPGRILGEAFVKDRQDLLGGIFMVDTNQGINISHLANRKIIFKSTSKMGYVSSQEGIHP